LISHAYCRLRYDKARAAPAQQSGGTQDVLLAHQSSPHRAGTTGQVNRALPLEKFIVWPYLARYENPYGTSDLRAAYRAYWIKDTAWKLRAVFLERFAGNNLIMSYPAEKAGLKDELLSVIKNWQSETGIVVPEEVTVDTIKMAAGSQSEFSAALADLNREILVGILGESLTVEAGKYGTRALGEVQDRAKRQDAALVAESLAAVVNQQLVRRLVDLNFRVDAYPEWTLVEPAEVDLRAEAEIDRILVGDIGLPLGRRYFYEKYGRPEPEPDAALIDRQGSIPSPPPGRSPSPLPGLDPLRRQPADHEDAAHLARIIDDTRDLAAKARHRFDRAVSRIALSIQAQVKTKGLLESAEFPVAVNVSAIKKLITGVRLTAHLTGRVHVREEIGLQANVRPHDQSTPEPLGPVATEPDEDSFSVPAVGRRFARRLGLDQKALIELTEELAESTFSLAGEIKDGLRTLARKILDRARKSGRDLAWLNQELAKAAALADSQRSAWWADLIWEAYGQGRWAELRANAVPALAFRVAVDTEANDFCRRMDEFIAPADDPVWSAIRLLVHPGCRALILPVIPGQRTPSPIPAGPKAG
ncbi:MAG: DUF935 family protein, partial [Proteobacteria bacterium]|nr:DUF935 family protein [Pseudomonadota bacterium]